MSTLTVPLTTVDAVNRHPKADRLDIAIIKGWQVVVGRDSMQAGDSIIYIPPDSIVPDEWARTWGILRDNADGTVTDYRSKGGRVKAIKLRSEPSFGLAIPLREAESEAIYTFARSEGISDAEARGDFERETDVAAAFGITKYEPIVRESRPGGNQGFGMPEHPLFFRYTDIENLRHHPTTFSDLEEVIAVEKLNGSNSRVGWIDGERVAGSHKVQRQDPLQASPAQPWYHRLGRFLLNLLRAGIDVEPVSRTDHSSPLYWSPFDLPAVNELFAELGCEHNQVILYGEIVGPNVQKLGYGVADGQTRFYAFDLMLDGKYADHGVFESYCYLYGVPMAPVIYRGPYSLEAIKAAARGKTTLEGASHIREGVVVRPQRERTHPRLGRLILKYVDDRYLTGDFED